MNGRASGENPSSGAHDVRATFSHKGRRKKARHGENLRSPTRRARIHRRELVFPAAPAVGGFDEGEGPLDSQAARDVEGFAGSLLAAEAGLWTARPGVPAGAGAGGCDLAAHGEGR